MMVNEVVINIIYIRKKELRLARLKIYTTTEGPETVVCSLGVAFN